MSEWEAQVYCTCFTGGLLIDLPPYPLPELEVNRFGVVTLRTSDNHADDPEDLECWRHGWDYEYHPDEDPTARPAPTPCRHGDMTVVNMIFYWPGCFYHAPECPELEKVLLGAPQLGRLRDVILHRGPDYAFSSGGIWIEADEARALLDQVEVARTLVQDDQWRILSSMDELLRASIATGNPVICHYNGIWDGAW